MLNITSFFSKTLALWFAAGMILLGITGCVSEKEEPVSEAPLLLTLKVSPGNPGNSGMSPLVRAAANPDYELPDLPEEELNHLRIIIVNVSTGEIVHNRSIFFKGGKPLGDDMRFRLLTSTRYRLYLFGNCRGLYTDINPESAEFAVGRILQQGKLEKIVLTGLPLINNQNGEKTDIPMTEIFDITTDAPSGEENQEQSEELFVTRAASKFSFNITTSEDYVGVSPKLTSIKINSIADRTFLFPRNAVYSPAKYQHSTNIYEGREIISFDQPSDTQTADYTYNLPTPLELRNANFNYNWMPEIYMAESAIPAGGFTCTLSFDNGSNWLIPVPLDNMPYGLPRNNHIKVNITLTNNNTALLTIKVIPWTTEIAVFDYSDQIGIASDGSLSFIAGSYKGLDKAEGHVVMNYPTPVEGSFMIATPRGARWDAYLITTSGSQDVIQFQQEDGTTTTHISGFVGTKLENFKVVSIVEPGNVANVAQLQVVVTMGDGHSLPANILQGGGYGPNIENMTFIQNPQ